MSSFIIQIRVFFFDLTDWDERCHTVTHFFVILLLWERFASKTGINWEKSMSDITAARCFKADSENSGEIQQNVTYTVYFTHIRVLTCTQI